ncbi:MAG TPA: hypothetical protein DEP60_08040 [Ruminococcaceae bacterium]|nr:zinc ribbon domain-containing protein [Oscillospiraceae bacterium]HCC02639.1 hypothetical protein [Oscillospiraceae bacterium]
MGLFEDMMINAKNAASAVGEKAGQFMDISKLRFNAADLNNEINKRFEALGRVTYDSQKTGSSSNELVREGIDAIDELYEQLDAVNEQLSEKRNHVTCSKCGQENSSSSVYCSKCGQKLYPETAESTTAQEPAEPTAEKTNNPEEKEDTNEKTQN